MIKKGKKEAKTGVAPPTTMPMTTIKGLLPPLVRHTARLAWRNVLWLLNSLSSTLLFHGGSGDSTQESGSGGAQSWAGLLEPQFPRKRV